MNPFRLKGTSGAVINQSFPLRERLVIGNSPDCDVRVGEDGPPGPWVEVVMDAKGGVMLRVLADSPPVGVNGKVRSEGQLQSGDEIRIGRSAFLLQAPGLRPQRVLAPEAVAPSRGAWPWLLAAGLAIAVALLAWQRGWLPL